MSFLYTLPTDVLVGPASAMSGVNDDADYPAANAANDNLALPAKFGATSFEVRVNLGGAHTPQFCAMFHTNLPAFATIRVNLQGATDSIYTAGVVTFGMNQLGLDSDGFSIDPYISASLIASPPSKQYWRLANADAYSGFQIGRWWLSHTVRSLAANFRPDIATTRAHPAITHETGMGTRLSYPKGIRDETISGTMRVTSADYVKLKTLYDVAGETRAFPIVLDTTVATMLSSVVEAYFVRFSLGFVFAPRFTGGPGLMDVPVSFVMVARGLVL